MAKSFNTIKSTKIGLYDKLTFGKYKDCRVIDLLPDNWEYLKWLIQNTSKQFDKAVEAKITECFAMEESYRHYVEEEQPWIKEAREIEVKDLFWKPSVSKEDWFHGKERERELRDIIDPLDDVPF